jgi:hypothetical protein
MRGVNVSKQTVIDSRLVEAGVTGYTTHTTNNYTAVFPMPTGPDALKHGLRYGMLEEHNSTTKYVMGGINACLHSKQHGAWLKDPDQNGDGELCGYEEFEQLAKNMFGGKSHYYTGDIQIECLRAANEPPQDNCLVLREQLSYLSCLEEHGS